MIKNSILSFFIFIFVFGCTNPEKINFDKPIIQIPKQIPAPINNKGSLYSRQGSSLFADKKDLQIGDIIQVVIAEELSGDTNNSRDLSKSNSSSLGGGVAAPSTGNTLNGRSQGLVDKFNQNFGFGISSESSSSFAGSAKSSLDESFNTTVSVIIEETYENGNYYIKGSKEMLIDGQKQEIKISGIIRPYDISTANSISSSQIANLKILYVKEGDEKNAVHVPWGTKVLNIIWPF